MKDSQIAILDEPTSGLDPQAGRAAQHHPRPQAPRRERAAVVAPARAGAERLRSRRAVQSGQHRAHRLGAGLGRQVLGGGFRVEVEAEGQGLAERIATIPGVQRVEAAGPTGSCSTPIATCARRPRRRWSRPAGACCGCRSKNRRSRRSIPATSRPMKESVMRREGSALHGFGVVTLKEIADHFTSILVVVLVVLIVATAVAVVAGPSTRSRRLRRRIRTCSCGCSPAAVRCRWSRCSRSWCRWWRSGSASTVNGEHNRRTLAHPVAADLSRRAAVREVHRRAVHPGGEPHRALASGDRARIAGARGAAERRGDGARPVLLVVTIAYAGFWFALALLFSVIFRSAATARWSRSGSGCS